MNSSAPKRLDFTSEQIDKLIDRLNQKSLAEEDYPLLTDLLRAMAWMSVSLQEKQLTIRRLCSIFGVKTETAKKLMQFAEQANNEKNSEDKSEEKPKKGNHGHRPATDFIKAKIIEIAHQALKKGSLCPNCLKGRLFNLSPGTVIRIVGQPWLQTEIYRAERLRCSLCGKIFTAILPKEVVTGSRADSSAKAIVSLLKYRGGVPFYRQGQLQEILGTPISANEIWQMTEEVADDLLPIYAVLCKQAAQAELLQNDDTKARILSIMERKKQTEEDRKGVFTTGILATLKKQDVKIALFFTGCKHAGENLNDLLDDREELEPPIQQCDGGHNIPKNHDTKVSNCLAHSRRKFYELVEVWPKEVIKTIGWFSVIFANEKSAPKDPLERLKWHQDHSDPIMRQLKDYCNDLIDRKEVEPNSSLGKAIAYMNNHWEGLTLFLRIPGVPLTNNDTERLLKRAVLNRKNAYFYRTETGAKIGDILMSVIETCVLNAINPWEYLIAIQEYQKDVLKNPTLWLPWSYEKRLKKLRLLT